MLAQQPPTEHLVVIANRELLEQRARMMGLPWRSLAFNPATQPAVASGALPVIDVPLAAAVTAGRLARANAAYVLRTLEVAVDGCMDGHFHAMVTAPVHKGIINDAGTAFTGHTEYLAQRTCTPHVVMMLVGGGLRVALATTHVAVKDIVRHITSASLEQTLRVLEFDLTTRFGIAAPRIAVAGLNPHAGDGGSLGREEIDVIAPAIERVRREGIDARGPLPADTMFHDAARKTYDCAICMYHDQALIPIKTLAFDDGVNVTLGLPFIRTSPDHGTAFDIAGSGRANPASLVAALRLAERMAAAGGA